MMNYTSLITGFSLLIFMGCANFQYINRSNVDYQLNQTVLIENFIDNTSSILLSEISDKLAYFQDEVSNVSDFMEIRNTAIVDSNFIADSRIIIGFIGIQDHITTNNGCSTLEISIQIRCEFEFMAEDNIKETIVFEENGMAKDSNCSNGQISILDTVESAIENVLENTANYFLKEFEI